MHSNSGLLLALINARTGLEVVLNDIRGRKDFDDTPELQDAVEALNAFGANLDKVQTNKNRPERLLRELPGKVSLLSKTILTNLIDENIKKMDIDQVEAHSCIDRSVARKHNENLAAEQSFLTNLISCVLECKEEANRPVRPVTMEVVVPRESKAKMMARFEKWVEKISKVEDETEPTLH